MQFPRGNKGIFFELAFGRYILKDLGMFANIEIPTYLLNPVYLYGKYT